MNQPDPISIHQDKPGLLRQGVLYPDCYTWLVFVSSMDLMLTWVIFHLGGWEANPLAAFVIDRFDLAGTVVFKFGLLALVIGICEFVGRRRPPAGRLLAVLSVAFPATGVLAGGILIVRSLF